MRRSFNVIALFAGLAVAGCSDASDPAQPDSPFGVEATRQPVASNPGVADEAEAAIREAAAFVEAKYGREGAVLYSANWLGDSDQLDMGGNLVFFNDRGNKQIPFQWVPGDPRRNGRTNLIYATDHAFFAPLDLASVDAAIDAGMNTWNTQSCSGRLSIDETSVFDIDYDIVHAGFVPWLSPSTIAVTFIFAFADASGATDIDGDGNLDMAFALIFYNPSFPWGFGSGMDLQTIALHEGGHGLGQDHFGKAFLNSGGVHFAPRAVMNATYSGVQQALTGTDRAGHCSIYGSWPNN